MRLQSEKLERFLSKKKNITLLYIILIIGVVILSLCSLFPKNAVPVQVEPAAHSEDIAATLTDILGAMDGVGHVRVAVSYENSAERIPAKDISERGEQVVTIGSGSSEQTVTLQERMPRVRGVIVVASGGGNAQVRQSIITAVQALTDIGVHSIAVFQGK